PGFGRCCFGNGGSGYFLAPSCTAPPLLFLSGRRRSSASTLAWILRCLAAAGFAPPSLRGPAFSPALVAFLAISNSLGSPPTPTRQSPKGCRAAVARGLASRHDPSYRGRQERMADRWRGGDEPARASCKTRRSRA